ncbi:hypothetical protein GCM10029964_113600 [Kibdelosporangium lantanae]
MVTAALAEASRNAQITLFGVGSVGRALPPVPQLAPMPVSLLAKAGGSGARAPAWANPAPGPGFWE